MPEKPKRPLSAFFIWLSSVREEIKKENPGCRVTVIAKRGGEIWRAMKDKSKWEAKALQAREDYDEAVKEFVANGGSMAANRAGKKRGKAAKKPAKKSKKAGSDDEEEEESD